MGWVGSGHTKWTHGQLWGTQYARRWYGAEQQTNVDTITTAICSDLILARESVAVCRLFEIYTHYPCLQVGMQVLSAVM